MSRCVGHQHLLVDQFITKPSQNPRNHETTKRKFDLVSGVFVVSWFRGFVIISMFGRFTTYSLKLIPKAELQYPREASRRRDQPERAAADVGVRAAELRTVRQVQDLEPQFRRLRSDGEVLREDGVGVLPELVPVVAVGARRVAVRAESRIRVSRRVDPR